jgi:putative Mn2+ efflux pump MntP
MKEGADKNTLQRLQQAQINRALGTFMLAFSLIVLVSIFFTQTFIGKMTNLVAGLIMGSIGAAMILKSRKTQKLEAKN